MSISTIDLSVILCTYSFERLDHLLEAVVSLQQQSTLPREIIIVVDHNQDLLQKVRSRLENTNIIENTGDKGLSGARNSGIAVSKGRLIAFLDDDELVDPGWVEKINYWCNQPGVLGAGGKVLAQWLTPRPGWFPEEFGWVLGFSYKGLPEQASPVRNLFGGSMCFHRTVFEGVGGFRSDIGRIEKKPLGCEETEFCIRVLQHFPEGKLIYEPQATIRHRTPPDRANWSYFVNRCFYEGMSKAIVTRLVGSQDGLRSERSYTFKVLPLGIIHGLRDTIIHGDFSGLARAFSILYGLSLTTAGYLVGSIRERAMRVKEPQYQSDLRVIG